MRSNDWPVFYQSIETNHRVCRQSKDAQMPQQEAINPWQITLMFRLLKCVGWSSGQHLAA